MHPKNYSPVWREKFHVRSFDIGLNAVMRISSLCSYFQEAAGNHATHLDVGYEYMQQSGMVWVLSRLFVNVKKLPERGQEFYLETWPLGTQRFFYHRDYKVDNGTETLITATSLWVLLDLNTRKPRVIPLDESVIKANAGRSNVQMPSVHFPVLFSGETLVHKVKYSDLDHNRHVNNAKYVEWIFDLIDQELLEKSTPSSFYIEYKQEVKSGDEVVLTKGSVQNVQNTYFVEGVLSGSRKSCVRAMIVF
jgi:medium-chain acyl-[acyl-carrier-protein] hydrolase